MAAEVEEGFAVLVLTAEGQIARMINVVRLEERCDPRTRGGGWRALPPEGQLARSGVGLRGGRRGQRRERERRKRV